VYDADTFVEVSLGCHNCHHHHHHNHHHHHHHYHHHHLTVTTIVIIIINTVTKRVPPLWQAKTLRRLTIGGCLTAIGLIFGALGVFVGVREEFLTPFAFASLPALAMGLSILLLHEGFVLDVNQVMMMLMMMMMMIMVDEGSTSSSPYLRWRWD
jgi:hypothetical protein